MLSWFKAGHKHSSAKILRYASSAAGEILSSNWNRDDYYMRLYKYASPELASHMYKNKSLLNSVLDERAELLGDFVEMRNLEQKPSGFSIFPSAIVNVAGTLHCKKGTAPLTILVNCAKEELSLDGIKVDKRAVQKFNK